MTSLSREIVVYITTSRHDRSGDLVDSLVRRSGRHLDGKKVTDWKTCPNEYHRTRTEHSSFIVRSQSPKKACTSHGISKQNVESLA